MADTTRHVYGPDTRNRMAKALPLLAGRGGKSLVGDRCDTLCAAIRMTVTMSATAIIALFLLAWSGWCIQVSA
jgi:hypothetical protein